MRMLFKSADHASDDPRKRRAADALHLVLHPILAYVGLAALLLRDPLLLPLLFVHALHLALFKAVPMWVHGPDAHRDLSNHVSSAALLVLALPIAGVLPIAPALAVLAAVAPAVMFAVLFRGQHDLNGALLGFLASALAAGAFGLDPRLLPIAPGLVFLLYARAYEATPWR